MGAILTLSLVALLLAGLAASSPVAAPAGQGGRPQPTWTSQPGATARAGFVGDCRASSRGRINCECLFSQLTSAPPYDTVSGLLALPDATARFQQTGNLTDMPVAVRRAIVGCATSA